LGPEPKYGFTGKEFNPDTELNYFGARYYSPNSGRFLNVDPALSDWTSYSYAYNNPLKYNDPDGRFPAAVALAPGGMNPISGAIIGGAILGYLGYRAYKYIREKRKQKPIVHPKSGHQPEDVPTYSSGVKLATESVQGTKPPPTRIIHPTTALAWKNEKILPVEPLPLSCLLEEGKRLSRGLVVDETMLNDILVQVEAGLLKPKEMLPHLV